MLIIFGLLTLSIFFILFGYDEVAIALNTISAASIIILLRKSKNNLLPQEQTNIKKDKITISTKAALDSLIQQKFNLIDFKTLKKENNPYIDELKTLSESIQKQQNRIKKRTRKLEARNLENVQLLSTISHEIKNPLSIIQASIETIILQPNIDNETHDKLLNKTVLYVKKINALLNKLTLSESLEHSVIHINMEKFKLKLLCEEVIGGFKNYLLKSVYIDKTITLAGEEREIYADRILIEQALNNLIYNGLKYADRKVTVHIKTDCIEIIDDGEGVEKQEIKQLTKKFYQGNKAKHNDYSLGLGLFIVKKIADIHNTFIEFQSKRNKKEGLCAKLMI